MPRSGVQLASLRVTHWPAGMGTGTVQVPSNGTPIALMADHQTTGGYPKIAEIASADVARLAQLGPGGTVHFARCTLDTAVELRRHILERLETALRGIAWEYGN